MRRFLEEAQTKPWGDVIGASFILMLATFSGVLFVAVSNIIRRSRNKEHDEVFWGKVTNIVIPSFGAGTLLATALLLIIPEAFSQIKEGAESAEVHHDEEEEDHDAEEKIANVTRFLFRLLQSNETDDHGNETSHHEGEEHHEDEEMHEGEEEEGHGNEAPIFWKFGASVLGGFIFPMLLAGFFPQSHVHMSPYENSQNVTEKDLVDVDEYEEEETRKADVESKPAETQVKNWGLIVSILFGDGLHNFCDGIFIGTGFLICGRAFAYSMVASTVYHELSQEISDFVLLVNLGGLSTVQALALNFLSGSTVLLGGVLALAIEFTSTGTGVILAISSGTFIYIAASECIPRIQAARNGLQDNLTFFISFACGAVPIGLVLLNHKHCESH